VTAMIQARQSSPAGGSLGTFGGVFTPSVLTILGLILFLRLGFVVGHGGLIQALLIIALANLISVLTSLSLAAIATNLQVKGGGDYYLISRTLGLEFGGAIGIVLFLAQAVSVGFYCIGLGEAVSSFLPQLPWATTQTIAGLAVAGLFLLAWLGADVAIRFQYVVMIALAIALASFFVGGLMKWDSALLMENLGQPLHSKGFWMVFAVFFPAVTGFTQGVSMSGDLKDPGRSLPLGTFGAVGVSILVYFAAAVVFAAVLPLEVLRQDFQAMERVAAVGPLIGVGVVAATLSSAMASFMGAPRILQALALDRIFPWLHPFAKGVGPADNPRRGVLLTAAIAAGIVGIGRLNLIAPLVSMFFLISYGLLNYATYYEARLASPSFRPRFRFYNHRLSLVGALVCLGAMLALNVYAGAVALALLLAIYQYLLRTAGPASWADSQRSYHLQQIRSHLLAAARETEHPRHWRPQILAFSDDPDRRLALLTFADWIEGKSGLTTAVRIIDDVGVKGLLERKAAREELVEAIQEAGSSAFPLAVAAPDLQSGIASVLQSYGIGPLQGNTVLLNWIQGGGSGGGRLIESTRNLKMVFRLGYNIIMLDARKGKLLKPGPASDQSRRIDIWWWGGATSRFMLLLAYLMTRHADWTGAPLRVLAVAPEGVRQETERHLLEILDSYRIEAEAEIVTMTRSAAIVEHSKDAGLVFIPFTFREDDLRGPLGGDLEWLLVRLPLTAMALAAEDIDLDAEPEEGPAAEQNEAVQALEQARKRRRQAEEESQEADRAAEVLRQKAEAAKAERPQDAEGIEHEAGEAAEVAKTAAKKLAKARGKEQELEKDMRKLNPALASSKDDSSSDNE